jgi:MSHA biogenesis protein MshO
MKAHTAGFTLIELIVTMTIIVIIVSFGAFIISGPISGFTDQVRRAELVDSAESSLRRIGRDVRRSLPNSVRITTNGTITALELLNVVEGVRYRAGPPPGDANARLIFNTADGAFNSIGLFNAITKPFSSTTHYLSVYNVGVAGANAYELSNVITPAGTQIDIDAAAEAGEDNVQLDPWFQFAYPSPRQRIYLIDTPVSFLCDTATEKLTRYAGYAIATNQADRDSAAELLAAGGVAALMSDNLTACTFTFTPGTAQRDGLVTMSLTVGPAGESIELLQQAHIDNVP